MITAFNKTISSKTHDLDIYIDNELALSISDDNVLPHLAPPIAMTSNDNLKYIFCRDKQGISIVNNVIEIGGHLTFKSRVKVTRLISVDCNIEHENGYINTSILIMGNYNENDDVDTTCVDDNSYNNVIKDISLQTYKFFCVFCNNETIVNSIDITNNICVDQTPLSIYYPDNSRCIIRGTYGLLAYILDQNLVLPLYGHNTNMVTSVMYNKFSGLLFSGDDNGNICMWQLNDNTYKTSISTFVEILYTVNTSTEVLLYVTTQNALLCITFFTKDNTHITRCLDISTNQNVKYFVSGNSSVIKIFKIHNDGNIVIVNSWNSKNNSQYNHKQLSFDISEIKSQQNDPFKEVAGKNPITLEEEAIAEYMVYSSDNIIIKNKENFYLSSKTMIKDKIPYQSLEECDMLKVGIPTQKIRKIGYKTMLDTNHQLFEVNNDKVIIMPESDLYHKRVLKSRYVFFKMSFDNFFSSDTSDIFKSLKKFFVIFCACYERPVKHDMLKIFEVDVNNIFKKITFLNSIFDVSENNINLNKNYSCLDFWLTDYNRTGQTYWIDISEGHNLFTEVYLQYFSSKSCVQSDISHKTYFEKYGREHFASCSRGLSLLVPNIKKIDETSGLKKIPKQIGFLGSLRGIFLRDCELTGEIPQELGLLNNLEIISLGNNNLTGKIPENIGSLTKLQRVILHCNDLEGDPSFLQNANCIVHLAGNKKIMFTDVPILERQSLIDFYNAFGGKNWMNNANWCSSSHVSSWYKVGVFNGHVEVIIESHNNLIGNTFPTSLKNLTHIKMIELAEMPNMTATLDEICNLKTLKRLCICKCGLKGNIPAEIQNLVDLQELQLFGNNLTGRILENIGALTNLKLLSLGEYTGGNPFLEGTIPTSFSNLTNLTALFLANCNLIGEFPSWISSLINLEQLDLQQNKLNGIIPDSISHLVELSYFNIKNNELSGIIPLSLFCCKKLRRLSIIDNKFTNSTEIKKLLTFCEVWI
jgi:Leucine-rich repeat (LRR) protein